MDALASRLSPDMNEVDIERLRTLIAGGVIRSEQPRSGCWGAIAGEMRSFVAEVQRNIHGGEPVIDAIRRAEESSLMLFFSDRDIVTVVQMFEEWAAMNDCGR